MFVLGINQGGSRPARHPIERNIVRIGSHPHCQVRFPELEPHAVTIERRADGFVVHNKTQRVLAIDGEALPSGGSADWNRGAELRLRSDLVATLDQIDESTDRSLSDRRSAPRFSDRNAPANRSDSRKLAGQLLLIASCLIATLIVLGNSANPGQGSDAQEEFALIADLIEADPFCQSVGFDMKRARIAMQVGNTQASRAYYRRARNLLLDRPRRQGRDEELCRSALQVVTTRLQS